MKKTKHRTTTLEQWVQVYITKGQTVTKLYPPNAELFKKYQDMDPKPDLIYRRINFRNRVPPEYFWTTGDPVRRQRGGHCIQRITPNTWLGVYKSEEDAPGHHLKACEIMPRPKDRGGCDCEACTAAAERIERELNRKDAA